MNRVFTSEPIRIHESVELRYPYFPALCISRRREGEAESELVTFVTFSSAASTSFIFLPHFNLYRFDIFFSFRGNYFILSKEDEY